MGGNQKVQYADTTDNTTLKQTRLAAFHFNCCYDYEAIRTVKQLVCGCEATDHFLTLQ